MAEDAAPVRAAHQDWYEFERALSVTLGEMCDGDMLVISEDSGPGFVQVAIQGEAGARIEAVCNNYIDDPVQQLSAGQEALLVQLGWSPPTGTDDQSAGDGSPNFYADHPNPLDFPQLSHLATQTLRLVYRVDAPDMLRYQAFTWEGRQLTCPSLEIAREVPPVPAPETRDADAKILRRVDKYVHQHLADLRRVEAQPDDGHAMVRQDEGCPACRRHRATLEAVIGDLSGRAIEKVTPDKSLYLYASYESATLARCPECGTHWLEQYWELVTPEAQLEEWGERYWASSPLSEADLLAIVDALKTGHPLPHNHFGARSNSITRTTAPSPSSLAE